MPCRSLVIGVNTERTFDRCYYQNLEESLFKRSEENHKGQTLDKFEHEQFYKVFHALGKSGGRKIMQ